jgi:hypothetical protein
MISIKQDSELMINYIPANPVAAGEHFVSIHDERSRPACFSMSSDKKLNLVIENDGAVVLTDFGAHIGITGDVQAFDAQQGNDLKLDICVAFVGDNSTSSFILIHQIRPRDLLNSISDVKIIKGSGLPTVHHLFMVS